MEKIEITQEEYDKLKENSNSFIHLAECIEIDSLIDDPNLRDFSYRLIAATLNTIEKEEKINPINN